jgi:hypothetical protein
MRQAMLLQDELAQAFGFVGVGLAQFVGIETIFGFPFEIATQ